MINHSLIDMADKSFHNSGGEEINISARLFWYHYYLHMLKREGLITEKEYE